MTAFLPPRQAAATILNRDAFKTSVDLVALRISAEASNSAMQCLKGRLLNVPKLRTIIPDESGGSGSRLVLLDTLISDTNVETWPQPIQTFIANHAATVTKYTLNLDYSFWSSEQILRSILPDSVEVPTSYEMIGHIAHLNLRPEHQPFKSIIGQVIIDKNKSVRTVVNKLDSIETKFRTFKMEILAGEDNLKTEMKESGCRFRFDFSSVYWNSRLQTEHRRLVEKYFHANEYVCDVMAGVGPFAIPAAKNKKCKVWANDLNPSSFQYLTENIALNKVSSNVKGFNMDGRAFIETSIMELNRAEPNAALNVPRIFNHYVLNLPASALEFLDAFKGLLNPYKDVFSNTEPALPLIHCYCFSKEVDCEADALKRAGEILGTPLADSVIEIHRVRDVAPKKEMLCLSFRLPKSVAFMSPGTKEKRKSTDAQVVNDEVLGERKAKR